MQANKLLKTVSSQFKLMTYTSEEAIDSRIIRSALLLRNETFSFQILYRTDPELKKLWTPLSLSIDSGTLPVETYRVDFVPVKCGTNDHNDEGFESNEAGMFPGPLRPRSPMPVIVDLKRNLFAEENETAHLSSDGSFSSVWVTLNPYGSAMDVGEHTIVIKLISLETGNEPASECFRVKVVGATAGKNELYYTNWFHVDCLCDRYRLQPYSEGFYTVFESYLENMAKHRQNTLLIPAFTPALDTPVGRERKNVQLVNVKKTVHGYSFGFAELKKFLDTARRHGIKYFEHCPLFSQWGADFAPNIYDSDGNLIFGRHTPSDSPEYVRFLREYLSQLLCFEKENGFEGSFIFHISDEPVRENIENYRKAVSAVKDILADRIIIDALADTEYFREGTVRTPVAFIDRAEEFCAVREENGRDIWLYYTGGTYAVGCSNRLVTNTAARTRVLGLQLYYYGAKGFLHWGYNYCYDYLSTGIFDTLSDPCGYKNYPGASFLAYDTPMGAIPSISEKLMGEAFDDICILKLYESFVGRDAVIAFCEKQLGKSIGTTLTPKDDELYFLRESIKTEICKHI